MGPPPPPAGPAAASDQVARHALPPLSALRVFDAIGRHGGIRRAAVALGIDHSSVSRQLKTLEQWAGVPLVNREASPGGYLTEEGKLYHSRISNALQEIVSASLDLTRRGESRQFRLWCAPGLASNWLSAKLGQFVSEFPEIDLELNPTEERPNFSAHEADVWLHYIRDTQVIPEADAMLRTEAAFRPPVIAVASAEYLERVGALNTGEDLSRAQLLHEADYDQWNRWFRKQGIAWDGPLTGPRFGQAHLTLAAAKRGQGIALANTLVSADSLASGDLVRVGDWPEVDLGGYLITARRDRWRDTYVTGFRSWLRRAMRAD